MRLARVRISALLLGLCLAGCGDGDQQSCTIESAADLKLLPGAESPTVEAALNGRRVAMLVDTGAQTSVVTPEAADSFNLRPAEGDQHMDIGGVGGRDYVPVVTLHNLELGHGYSRNLNLPVSTSLKGPVDGIPLIGLFGADFMSNYDVDIDVPNHHFGLYSLHQCGAEIAPFEGTYFEVPFRIEDTAIKVDVKINNVPVTAELDTGTTVTLIDSADARRLGLTRGQLSSDQIIHEKQDAEDQLDMTVHRFDSLEIGAERMNNFHFTVANTYTGVTLLGDDFFRHNRVWISYPRQMLYIQPASNDTMIHQDGHVAAK